MERLGEFLLLPNLPPPQSSNLSLQPRILPTQKLYSPLHIPDPAAHLHRRQARLKHEPFQSFLRLVLFSLRLRNEEVAGELREVLRLPLDRAVGEERGVDREETAEVGGDGVAGGAEEEAGAGGVRGAWMGVKEDIQGCARGGEGEAEACEDFGRACEDGCGGGFEWRELFSCLGWNLGCDSNEEDDGRRTIGDFKLVRFARAKAGVDEIEISSIT